MILQATWFVVHQVLDDKEAPVHHPTFHSHYGKLLPIFSTYDRASAFATTCKHAYGCVVVSKTNTSPENELAGFLRKVILDGRMHYGLLDPPTGPLPAAVNFISLEDKLREI